MVAARQIVNTWRHRILSHFSSLSGEIGNRGPVSDDLCSSGTFNPSSLTHSLTVGRGVRELGFKVPVTLNNIGEICFKPHPKKSEAGIEYAKARLVR